MNEKKYFVVSLPRSGTTSICKMAKMCGLKPKHAPHFSFLRSTKRNEFNFFADTPVFCPDQIEIICNEKELDSNFIFINRNFDEFFTSWVDSKLYRNYMGLINASDEELRPSQKFDLDTYNRTFENKVLTEDNFIDICKKHKETVLNILNDHKKNVLVYNFENGWVPFCNFTNTEIPKEDIPVLNKNKMFDKYE